MDLAAYFQQLYDYHYWANRLCLDTAKSLSEEQLRRPQGHSWGSVYGTLLHLLSAEWIWLERWQGRSPAGHIREAELPTLAVLEQRWRAQEAEMRRFLAAQSEDSLTAEVHYTSTQGLPFHQPLWQMIGHVANHGTHHRGELAAMFTLLGVTHAEGDWLHYFRQMSGQG